MHSRKHLRVLLMVMLLTLALGVSTHAQVLTGFEGGHPFTGADHVISISTSTDWASEGDRSLRINHASIPAGDSNRLWVRVDGSFDWTGATTVQADFYVPEDAVQNYSAALMVQVGEGWTWYESSKVELEPGENLDATFHLTTSDWSASATGWQPAVAPPLSGMRVYGFLIFSDDRTPGHVYMDNVRLNRPAGAAEEKADDAPVATAGGGIAERIKISGSAELTVVAQPVEKEVGGGVPRFDVPLLPSSWSGGAARTLASDTVDGLPVQALRVDGLPSGTGFLMELGGEDLSEYKYLVLDVKLLDVDDPADPTRSGVGLQFVKNPGGGETGFPWAPLGDWERMVVELDDIHNDWTDVTQAGFRTFDGETSLMVANVHFLGEPTDVKTITETVISRSHNVSVNLDYEISPDWAFHMGAKFNDPIPELGLIELKGNAGILGLRGFHNGTSADLGDPMGLFKGAKFGENSTSGIDVSAPIGSGQLHGMLSRPSGDNPDERTFIGGSYNFPLGMIGNVTVLGATETAQGMESRSVFGGAAKLFLGVNEITLELADGGKHEDAYAWWAELSRPLGDAINLKLHWRSYGRGMSSTSTAYTDHNDSGYDQKFIDASWKLSDQLSASAYIQNYATHDGYDDNYTKLTGTWNGPGFTLSVSDELSKLLKSGQRVFGSGNTRFKATTGIVGIDLEGILLLTKTPSDGSLPAYVARASFEPISNLSIALEAGQAKVNPDDDPTQNTYAKITRKFQNGELSLAFGKTTLNDDENKVDNAKTAEGYIEMKVSVSF